MPTTLQEWAWIAAIVAPTGALYYFMRPIVVGLWQRVWSAVSTPVKSHFAGVRQMIADVAAMKAEQSAIKAEISDVKTEVSAIKRRVEAELGPNGGGSMKDQVTILTARQDAVFDSLEHPAFKADAAGRFIAVNRALEHLTGYPERDLLGMGWVNLIHQEHVDGFMLAWQHTIRDGRILRRDCVVVKANSDELVVCVDVVPVRSGRRVIEWQGTFIYPEGKAA